MAGRIPGIVMSCSTVEPGTGIMAAVAPLARELIAAGAAVSVIGPRGDVAIPSPVGAVSGGDDTGLKPKGGRWLSAVSDARKAWRAMSKLYAATPRPVLHVHGVWTAANVTACGYAQSRRLPYIVSPHGMLMPAARVRSRLKKAWAIWAYVRRNLERAAVVHVTSEAERDSVLAVAPRARVVIVPWGIDLPPADPRLRGPEPERTALYLGRLITIKGVDDLIEAWAAVRPAGWRLRLVGPDSEGYAESLRTRVGEFGLRNTVTIEREIPPEAVPGVLRDARLVVLPSHSENYGFVVAEALANGVPILTTTATPWARVDELGCGWWVPDTARAIATALTAATCETDEQLARRGERGRTWMRAEFSWQPAAQRFVSEMYTPAAQGL